MMAVVETLGPSLDPLLCVGLTLMGIFHGRGLSGVAVARQVERMKHLVVAPRAAEEVGNASRRASHVAADSLQHLRRLATYILGEAQVAFDEVSRDVFPRRQQAAVFRLGDSALPFRGLILFVELPYAVDVSGQGSVALTLHEIVGRELPLGGIAPAA